MYALNWIQFIIVSHPSPVALVAEDLCLSSAYVRDI